MDVRAPADPPELRRPRFAWAGYATCACGMGLVGAAVGELGIVESIDPSTVRWYLLLWEPYWVLGGLLFLAAAWHFRQSSPSVAAGRG